MDPCQVLWTNIFKTETKITQLAWTMLQTPPPPQALSFKPPVQKSPIPPNLVSHHPLNVHAPKLVPPHPLNHPNAHAPPLDRLNPVSISFDTPHPPPLCAVKHPLPPHLPSRIPPHLLMVMQKEMQSTYYSTT